MKEVNAINKRCQKCQKLLPVAFFSKKTKSADGLQAWCKDCQKENSQVNSVLRKKRKRKNELTILSYYHRKHGLEYRFLESKKKKEYRKYIVYKCLYCGKEVESSIKAAIENKFTCGHCDENKNTKKVHEEIFTTMWDSQEHSIQQCQCENHSCNECNEISPEVNSELYKLNDGLTQDEILNKVEKIRSKLRQQKAMENVHVIVLQVPEQIQQQSKKKGFWNWIKSLFHK